MARKTIKEVTIRSSAAEYLTFVAASGDDKNSVEVRYEDENIWITQKMLAVLYEIDVAGINYHIKKIYDDNELTPEATIKNFLIVQNEGGREVSREVKHYNLQMIIAVGFKVNSERAVQFRKWVNNIPSKALQWMMSVLKMMAQFLQKSILRNSWNESVRFVPVSASFIRKLLTFMLLQLTMTKMPPLQNVFMPPFRTKCILPFMGTQQQN